MAARDTSGQDPSDGPISGGKNTQEPTDGADKPDQFWQSLSIAVFKGDPIDAYIYRHVGLYLQTFRGDILVHHQFLETSGATGSFVKQDVPEWDPFQDAGSCGHVQVAKKLPMTSETDRTLRNTIWSTPLKNDDRSWNCQNWVGDALQRCVDASCLTRGQMDCALDRMVDILLEATDVET